MTGDAATAPVTLTPRQRAVLVFIVSYWSEHLTFPALRDVAAEFGMAGPTGAVGHVNALRKKGLLARTPGRGLVVLGLREAVAGAAEAFTRDLLAGVDVDAAR